MVKDKIIELENGTNYYVIEEIDHNDKKYVLAAMCDLEKEEVNEEDYIVMEIKIEDDALVTKNINDDNIARIVAEKLIEKVRAE
jgi:hypothetical protein